MAIDLKKLNEKFFTDPDWAMMEELLMEYLEPFRSVMNIPKSMSNAEIAAEIRGRQLMITSLDKFLADSKVIRSSINREPKSYK